MNASETPADFIGAVAPTFPIKATDDTLSEAFRHNEGIKTTSADFDKVNSIVAGEVDPRNDNDIVTSNTDVKDTLSANQHVTKRKVNDSESSDSEIEDVTDQYAKKRRPLSPEIIEVEDVSSEEEPDSGSQDINKQVHSDAVKNGRGDNDEDENHSNDGSDGGLCDLSSESDIEDVTDFMLAQKKEQYLKDMIDIGESEDDDTMNPTTKRKTKRRSSTQPQKRKIVLHSPIEVLIDEKDIPSCPGQKCSDDDEKDTMDSTSKDSPHGNDVDHTIKQRIVKLLNTGFHTQSNENEAKNAMKLARRLMERHNLDQAVLLRERGDGSLNHFSTTNDDKDGTSALNGGIVKVNICYRRMGKPLSSMPSWIDFLVHPICANFRVDAFKYIKKANAYREGECSVSFYGIKMNAQLAAYAFKIASEKISLMAANYEPFTPGETRKARLSYALGVVIGIDDYVKEELKKEEKRRKTKLRKARQADKSGECNDSSDAEVEASDDGLDLNNPIDLTLEQLESEDAAQLALIDHQRKLAEEILKVRQCCDRFQYYLFCVPLTIATNSSYCRTTG